MIVTVYIDESGTHESGYTILGGWVGRFGQWVSFDAKWKRLLKKYNAPYFRSKEMMHTQGPFKNWPIRSKSAFMEEAAKLALKHLEFGFTICLTDDDYQKHYIADRTPRSIPFDSKYGLCFRYALGAITDFAKQAYGDRDLDVHFVLESGHRNYGDAERIFEKVKRSSDPDDHQVVKMLRTLSRGDKVDFPGLQVADVNAYNAYQHYTRSPMELTDLPPEDAIKHAKRSEKVPILNLPLSENGLSKFRQFRFDEATEKKKRKVSRKAK